MVERQRLWAQGLGPKAENNAMKCFWLEPPHQLAAREIRQERREVELEPAIGRDSGECERALGTGPEADDDGVLARLEVQSGDHLLGRVSVDGTAIIGTPRRSQVGRAATA